MLRTESAPERAGPDLANLLFGAYRYRVLSLLLLRPGDRFHVRMISRLTGIPAGSLHRELRQLADAGLLFAVRSGNQVLYSANEASPVFHELAAMLDKTAGTPPTLHEHVAEHTVEPAGRQPDIDRKAIAAVCRKYGVRKMSVFGPAARGELGPDGGVDLLVEFKRSSKATLFDYVGMRDALSSLFGNRPVQIAGPEILDNPERRRTLEAELTTLYAARRT
jgi:predicted nucleotidyltransferase